MISIARTSLQVGAFAAFAAFVGYLSAAPGYQYADAGKSWIKLSLSHAADRVKPCVILTPEQMAERAPNMRVAEQCERERLPLAVALLIDGDVVIRLDAAPSGLWSDGPASIYERFAVEPGEYLITARLRDTNRDSGWDYELTETVALEAGRYFTVTFNPSAGGFIFR